MASGLLNTLISARSDRNPKPMDIRRRQIAKGMLAVPFIAVPCRTAVAAPRTLRFYHTHTGEKLALSYHENGDYEGDALAEVNWFLRDFRTGESHPINPQLLDVLHRVLKLTESQGTYQVISGFRSPVTNKMLRNKSKKSGVAKKSLHMTGNALDVRLTGLGTGSLRRAAVSLQLGGVGYYPKSDFIHIDTGRVRTW